MRVATLLLAVLCALALPAAAEERVALLVGSAEGRRDQAPLRYTGADTTRMAQALSELGGFPAPSVVQLQAHRAQEVLDGLAQLARRPEPAGVFVFYYSGHGDSEGVQVGETALPLETLLAAVRRVPAQLHVLVLDACQSGAATRGKGVGIGAPIEVQIDAAGSQGEVIISSSSATEESYESESLGGAVFTVHWVSGLRGAADEDGDGLVTLSEAYRYAYERTVSSTLLSSRGPQRPAFHWDLAGQREPVLATGGALSRLNLQASRTGDFFVFDADERALIVELPSVRDRSSHVRLVPGRYVVRQRTPEALRSAQVELKPGDDLVLDDRQMTGVRLVRLAKKGGVGQWSLVAHAGQTFSSLGQQSLLTVHAGGELERGPLLLSLSGRFLSGGMDEDGLRVQQTGGGLNAEALFGVTLATVTLRGGPNLGVLVMNQSLTGRVPVTGALVTVGATARVELELTRTLSLLAQVRGETWWGPAHAPYGPLATPVGRNWGLFLNIGWSVGIRAAF